jgi:hypothetical protein
MLSIIILSLTIASICDLNLALSLECRDNFDEIKVYFVNKTNKEWAKKCKNSLKFWGSAQEKPEIKRCCSTYQIMDGLKGLIKRVKECIREDIEEFVALMDKNIEMMDKSCPKYRYHSDVCVKLQNLGSICGLNSTKSWLKPIACILYLMASLFIALLVF